MAKLPSSQDVRRSVPNPQRGIVSMRADQTGAALAGIGDDITRQATAYIERERQEQERVQLATAQANLVQAENAAQASLLEDPDYTTHVSKFEQTMQPRISEIASRISDERLREVFVQNAHSRISNTQLSVHQNALKLRRDTVKSGVMEYANNVVNSAPTKKPEQVQEDLRNLRNVLGANAGVNMSQTEATAMFQTTAEQAVSGLIDSLPAETQRALLNGESIVPATTGDPVYDEIIQEVSSEYNVPQSYFMRLLPREATTATAVNPRSGAAGPAQFMPDVAKAYGVDNVFDPRQSIEGAAKLYIDNKNYFKKTMNREPTEAELMFMHQQGMGGATALLKAGEGELAVDVLIRDTKQWRNNPEGAKKAVKDNGGSLDMTAQEFANHVINYYAQGEYGQLSQYITPAKRKSLLQSANSKIKAEFRQELKDFNDAVKLNVPVADEVLDNLERRAGILQMDDEVTAIQSYRANREELSEFIQMPMSEASQKVTEVLAEAKTDLKRAALYGMMQESLSNKIEAINKNPYAYYRQTGQIEEDVATLNFDEPLAEQIAARRVASESIQSLENSAFRPPLLTDDDIGYLEDVYKSQDLQGLTLLMSQLKSEMDVNELQNVSRKIAPKDPLLATAMLLDPQDATRVLGGKFAQVRLPEDDMKKEILDRIGAAIPFPQQQGTYVAATKSMLQSLVVESGKENETLVSAVDDLIDDAVKRVVGEKAEFSYGENNHTVILPDGMDEDDLEDAFNALSDGYLATKITGSSVIDGVIAMPQTQDGMTITVEDIQEYGRIISIGEGEYMVRIEGLGDVVDPNTMRPLILNAHELLAHRKMKD